MIKEYLWLQRLQKISKLDRKFILVAPRFGQKKGAGYSLNLEQACQTQITVRAAHWIVKLEKLTAGRSLELHDTLCQF